MSVSRLEQETYFNFNIVEPMLDISQRRSLSDSFNEAEPDAVIATYNASLSRKLLGAMDEHPEIKLVKQNDDSLEGSSFKLEVIYEVVRGLSNHTIYFSDSFSLDIDYAKVILYKSSRPLYNDEKHILDEISHYGSQENMDNYFLNRKDYDEQEIVKLL